MVRGGVGVGVGGGGLSSCGSGPLVMYSVDHQCVRFQVRRPVVYGTVTCATGWEAEGLPSFKRKIFLAFILGLYGLYSGPLCLYSGPLGPLFWAFMTFILGLYGL